MSNNLEERFETAVEEIKKLPTTPQQEDLLKLYGLYKRVTFGICNIEKPWVVQIEASLKWNAWNDVSSLTKNQAMTTYIMITNKLFRENNIYKNI
jgi:diazepam-binding inhibitor (GABA receptor modulator, acyl-CoA-binding protein)|uniref:ACB domain-containing protein n=1 Tax=viral metagenome TaxID=1070528 RepID=A0A6C0ILL7_9ZZZZ